MSTVLDRPSPAASPARGAAPANPPAEALLTVATGALVLAACLPLVRVYLGVDFFRPVLAGAVLSLTLAWVCRRYGAGPVTSLLASVAGWVVFSGVAFAADTLWLGALPTRATLGALRDLWVRGMELVRLRPAPTFAEAGLLLLTVAGVWAIAHAVEGLVFRLRTPLRAVVLALTLWTVPLAIAPPGPSPWRLAAPLLAASALLLLAFAGSDLARWGAWLAPGGRARAGGTGTVRPAGAVIALVAIVVGGALAGVLPGWGEPPYYQVRGLGGTTLTTNPIVNIRSRLVAQDTGSLLRVRTERPVYLRTTSLDVYSATEEWTNGGIRGAAVGRAIPFEVDIARAETVAVQVTVDGLDPASVLVPAPYQATRVLGPVADHFQYDVANATFTLDRGTELARGDTYEVVAAVPAPDPDLLDSVDNREVDTVRTALPANVPQSVRDLARAIVDQAGATTPFQQALAIQNVLRSWTYSLEVPEGHSGQAIEAFITNRVGYCEQFAGTMAVMLRTLGIPARVAVGFTPGQQVAPGEYEITNANAHAWVEVLFPQLGWIAFEPTPRADGNVLVPSAANLAPTQTAAEQSLELADPALTDEQEQSALRENANAELPTAQPLPPAPAPAPASEQRSGRRLLLVLVAVAGGGLLLGAFARRGRSAGGSGLPTTARVLRASGRVERLGRGLGVAPRPWETDREYLRRLDAGGDGATLASAAAQARYARVLPDDVAEAAEAAADRLCARLLDDVAAVRRPLVRARGAVSAAWRR
jgi:transglutaminase-like putative cysteine protease